MVDLVRGKEAVRAGGAEVGEGAFVEPRGRDDAVGGEVVDDEVDELDLCRVELLAIEKAGESFLCSVAVEADRKSVV